MGTNPRCVEKWSKYLLFAVSFQISAISIAQESKFETFVISSDLVPIAVDVGVLTPSGYSESTGPYPLILVLHGGGGNSSQLGGRSRAIFDEAWKSSELPPAVVVTPSTGRSFYMDYRDGSQKWESFILTELLPELRERYNIKTDPAGTFIMGISMGEWVR